MNEIAGTARGPDVQLRLAGLRAEHGFAEFALEQSTTGTDATRLVSVVVDPTRRLTSLTLHADDRLPSLDALARALSEARTAAETARSLHSYAIAREKGLITPRPFRRRFLEPQGRAEIEATAMALPVDPPAPSTTPRPEPSRVFAALGLDQDDPVDASPSTGDARGTHGPVVGGDPERGVRVSLDGDGWTSTVHLEPWLASASPRVLERALLDAFTDAYDQHDRRHPASTGG